MSLDRRLTRLETRLRTRPPVRAPVDRAALYRTLEAAGLVYWDERKDYWSVTDPVLCRAWLRQR